MSIRVFDTDGNERDLAWALNKYNPIIACAPKRKDHWELVELHESIGPSSLTVRLVGDIIYGVPIAFYWPDAEESSHPSEPKPVKNVQITDVNGQTGFGMGPGAYYKPSLGEHGPHAVWVSEYPNIISDMVDGLGMIAGTNHDHLEPTFEYVMGSEEEPEPTPEDGKKYEISFTGTLVVKEVI